MLLRVFFCVAPRLVLPASSRGWGQDAARERGKSFTVEREGS